MGDMVIFALFFAVFVYYRGEQPSLFAQSQSQLNVHYGALNTLLLLTSSWFVVMGVNAARQLKNAQSAVLFILAILCGLGFSTVKFIEYSEKIAAGITMTSNDFFMYYYIFTGLHFVHVMIGMVILIFVVRALLISKVHSNDMSFIEVGASYWHMVDLLWIILFPLIYLMK